MDAAADELLSGSLGMAFAVVWGAVWGSFFNVVIARLPQGRSLVSPPSSCATCGAQVRPFDNVPVLAFVWLRGRCRACGARFSARYPLVELLTAGLSALLWWTVVAREMDVSLGLRLARFSLYFAFLGILLVLSFIDLDTRRLPDLLTIPGTAIFFVGGFAVRDVVWLERAIGIAAGYLFVRIIADFYYYVLKREGLGLGDGKLLALIGALLGWRALPPVIFLASVLGTSITIPILLVQRSRRATVATATFTSVDDDNVSLRKVQVPFGPFIGMAAVTYLFAYLWLGDPLTLWILPPD